MLSIRNWPTWHHGYAVYNYFNVLVFIGSVYKTQQAHPVTLHSSNISMISIYTWESSLEAERMYRQCDFTTPNISDHA